MNRDMEEKGIVSGLRFIMEFRFPVGWGPLNYSEPFETGEQIWIENAVSAVVQSDVENKQSEV